MAYSKEHTDQLTDNWSAITNDVEMRYIVDLLIQKRVISPTDWDDMKKAHPVSKDQMHAFLTFLVKQPKASFINFIEALKESGKYDHIVELLQTPVSRNPPSGQKEISEEDKQKLHRHWRTIQNSLSMRHIIDSLIADGIISHGEWEDINKNNAAEKEKTEAFLLYLLQQPADAYGAFIKVLDRGNYSYLVDKLERRTPTAMPGPSSRREAEMHEKGQAKEDHSIFNAENFKLLWERMEKVENNREQTQRKLETLNREIDDLKITLKTKEKEISRLEEMNKKKEGENTKLLLKLERNITELQEEKHLRGEAESKLLRSEEELQTVLREYTELSMLSRPSTTRSQSTPRAISSQFNSRSKKAALERHVEELTKEIDTKKREKAFLEKDLKDLKRSGVCSVQ